MAHNPKICIIGAGLSGLSCGYYLEKLGYEVKIIEEQKEVGGRLSTERVDGFLLDRGFQVCLSSYFELKKIVRLYELEGGYFPSGARVYFDKKWYELKNPLKNPLALLQWRKVPFAQFSDLVKLASLYFKAAFKPRDPIFHDSKELLVEFLKNNNISDGFIEKFIRPFVGGIFLDRSLDVNVDLFLWVLHFFIEGRAFLPRGGMQKIAVSMASKLKKSKIVLGRRVSAVEGQLVFLDDGEVIKADKIVLATSADGARQLVPSLPEMSYQRGVTLYYSLAREGKDVNSYSYLHLNGDGEGPINSVAFPSLIQPSYAPKNKILAAIGVIDPVWQGRGEELSEAAHSQLCEMLKIKPSKVEFIKEYQIEKALPNQKEPPLLQRNYSIDRQPDIYLCGEYVDQASINGAVASGRKAALQVEEGLKRLYQSDFKV